MNADVSAAVPEKLYCLVTIHEGSDWGIFLASADDIENDCAFTHAEALQHGRSHTHGTNSRLYDFGDEVFRCDE